MKIIVTGGAGYLGSVLSQDILSRGHELILADSLVNGGDPILGFYTNDNFTFHQVDIRDIPESIFYGADAVVHLAAIVGDPACAREPDLATDVNLRSALSVFKLCQNLSVKRFVFASTCSNYGKVIDPTELVTEDSDLGPVSLYAETKVAVERALLDYGSGNDTSVTILRFATLFGISPRMRFDLTVNQFTAEMLTNQTLDVYGEQFWRPYVHVNDAARAIIMTLTAPVDTIDCQVFNVGDTSQNYRKKDLVNMINDHIGNSANINFVHKQEDPRDYKVSFEKIQRVLDFKITRTVEDGISEILDVVRQGVITDWQHSRYGN